MIKNKAVFFDRDGVLNVDSGYLHSYDQLQWIPGARETIAKLTQAGWLLFVVTNQSGVARGYFTEADVMKLHRAMNEEFAKIGGRITEFLYCPHLPNAPIKKYDCICSCRKPAPGMILKALENYQICPNRAVLFGDSLRDIEAADNAGINGFLYRGGDLWNFVRENLPDLK